MSRVTGRPAGRATGRRSLATLVGSLAAIALAAPLVGPPAGAAADPATSLLVAAGDPEEEVSTAPAERRQRWDTRVTTRVPRPGYPAFVYHHPNGRLYAATYTNPQGDEQRSRVFEWTKSGTLLRSWTVPGQDLQGEQGAQAALSDAAGRLVVLEKSTSRVMRLDLGTGRFSTYARIPDLPTCAPGEEPDGSCSPNATDSPAIPNYAAWGRRGVLYVTDYGQAVVWRVPPGGGRATAWFADRRLDGGEFGTAGLLMTPGHRALLLTQQTSSGTAATTQGTLFRLGIRDDGRPGRMRGLWTSRPGDLPDGFGIARSGRIYLANAGLSNQLVRLSPTGEELERFPAVPGSGENGSAVPFDTPSNTTFAGRRVFVANQSFAGDREHHAILDVHVGERGEPVWIPRRAGR